MYFCLSLYLLHFFNLLIIPDTYLIVSKLNIQVINTKYYPLT